MSELNFLRLVVGIENFVLLMVGAYYAGKSIYDRDR